MRNGSRQGKYWTEEELMTLHDLWLKDYKTSGMARKLGRSAPSVAGAISKLRRIITKGHLESAETVSQCFYTAAEKIKAESAKETKEVEVNETETVNHFDADEIQRQLVAEFSDYLDEFKHRVVDYASQLVTVSLSLKQEALLTERDALVKRVSELEKEVDLLKPVVEVVKKENTRTMLEKAMGGFFRK